MTTGILHDQNLEKQIEKQMGCMTGFLHIFDRNQILNGKRLYTAKRIPHYPALDYSSQSESSVGSPAFSGELRPNHSKEQQKVRDLRSPAAETTETPPRMSLPFEFKEGLRSSWKFKEAPRLSLDSRATVDGKGSLYPKEIRTTNAGAKEDESDKQRRSPSVIARLMGLDALPESGREPMKKVELRRSASESRVSRDLRFADGNNFQTNAGFKECNTNTNVQDQRMKARTPPPEISNPSFDSQKPQNVYLAPLPWKSSSPQQQRKSYFDSEDFFPEPKQSGYLYGEIEKRLRLRGIDEPAKDLETLKQILEALQLKGLLHSKRPEERNFVFDKRFSGQESLTPIVIMNPSRTINRSGRAGVGAKPGVNRNLNFSVEISPPARRIDRNERNVKLNKQNQQSQSCDKSPSSLARRRVANVENQKRNAPMSSPKKKIPAEQNTNRSPRIRKPLVSKERTSCIAEDQPESRRSSSSQIDTERSKMEDYKEGRSLLERCDKLLNSIAEITSTTTSTTTELQPSPVSVLDSSFYKEESSPSPVMKRSIDFKDQSLEFEDENWSPAISPIRLKSNDSDFLYVSAVIKASNCLSEDVDIFWLLEKQQHRTNSSDSSRLHRKLVFDIITEILDRKTQLPPWKTFCRTGASNFEQIWLEFRTIRENDEAEDLFEIIGGVLKKDMAGDSTIGWVDTPMETSEAVLDIERLIFKDLVVETIQDLAVFSRRNRAPLLRRKLVFN